MKLLRCVGWMLLATVVEGAGLPVRDVVLYKHGIGYFERSGQLAAGESAHLDFKASEMNDVLKSLTIVEKGGGKVSGLRYDSSEPLEQKLSEYPFRIAPGQPLSAILDQLKGAMIELKFGSETVRGAIISGRINPPLDEKHPQSEQITLLLSGGEMRNFELAAASSIRFLDAALQTQFQEYLETLVGARSKEKRSVYIDSTAGQSRQIFANYMIPMPVWKSTYRLIWGSGGDAMLEGWAIVDNTTDEDWDNVQLSLVSGRPISFISQLYEPRYIARPTAELPEDRAQAPVVYQGTIGGVAKAAPAAAPAQRMKIEANAMGALSDASSAQMEALEFDKKAREEVPSSIAATAASGELGELFEYRFPAAVTVKKNESAMLPFVQQKIDVRKLLVYTGANPLYPLNSAEITNSIGKTLDGGPITVYDDNAYAGEALMETLKTGDKRLISYGVDLGTRITTQFDSKGEVVREIHFRRGVLTAKTAAVETKVYTIHNVDQKAKTLIIEHPERPQYKVTDQKPIETTANAYRFEVKLGPGATEKFPVTEERVYDNTLSITNLTTDVLFTYTQNKNLSPAARTQLEQILDRKRQIAANDAEIHRTEAQTTAMVQAQERLRQNINS